MGVDVRIEDENGNERAVLIDSVNFLAAAIDSGLVKDTTCLRFIDPWADTTFNSLQIPVLIAELHVLAEAVNDQRIGEHLRKIIEMGKQALAEVHLYLKFYGD